MSNKKKNIFDYILMGVKNTKSSDEKRKIAVERDKIKATKFDEAFSNKTYSVAKKVIDNVEKVADYDYESFFSRVNKAIDGKLSQHKENNRNLDSQNRTERSKEVKKNLEEHTSNFKINDYSPKSSKNYKDSLIEKTKTNIRKKIMDAEIKSKKIKEDFNKSDSVEKFKLKEEDSIKIEATKENKPIKVKSVDLSKTTRVNGEISAKTDEITEPPFTKVVNIEDGSSGREIPDIEKIEKKSRHEKAVEKKKTAEKVLQEYQEAKYSKENLEKNSKYYKNKKREKFAKIMSVELEDNLLVKKKRSITRLFKFSIAFKLSFVFILLIISTVVSLSIAFYLGIDYVIFLKEAGKLEDIKFFKDVLLILLIIFDFIAIIICVSLGTKTSRRLVQPIDEMTQIVKEINANEMDRRLDVKGIHDELRELAVTFNEMLDRIENSYDTQNRFTSDASHELRTPIAVIQGYINMLDRWGKADSAILDESIEAIKSESNNMKKLTEKLLLLAKADKGILELEFKPFELNELISEITRETKMIDSDHTITNDINDVKTIIADRESLKQAIRIFVDNSVKYTPPGGTISLNSYINKKKIYIEIADNGIGISKDDMDNIFNRFYRVDKSRTKESGGHGLGLSISKWIINQHKGNIEVKSELGKGTVVTVILSPKTISEN